MNHQLRIYRVKAGMLDEFTALFRDHLVPAREAHGFTVDGAWIGEDGTFAWVVSHPGDFAAADATYYASPERAAAPRDPRDFLEDVDLRMVEPLQAS